MAIHRRHIHKVALGGGDDRRKQPPTDRGKLGTKRHILADKKGIPLSVAVSPASSHDIKLVADVVDNTVIRRPESSPISALTHKIRRRQQHLCLDKAYNSAQEEQELIKRGYALHIPCKKKKGEEDNKEEKIKEAMPNHKKHSAKRWVVVERTNSWHNRFRKLFTRYEKKVGNYLGLVQFSCCMIIYRKIILG